MKKKIKTKIKKFSLKNGSTITFKKGTGKFVGTFLGPVCI